MSTPSSERPRTTSSRTARERGFCPRAIRAASCPRRIVAGERYVQIGLRGYWPGETEFAWQREHEITSLFMHDVRDLGMEALTGIALTRRGPNEMLTSR